MAGPDAQTRKATDVKQLRSQLGIMFLASMLFYFVAEGSESSGETVEDLRPTHIDVDGDQDVIEKAYEPGSHGADNLSHARRSTVYIGSVQLPMQDPRIGYHPTKEIRFTSRATAFVYAYPIPKFKTVMDARGDDDGNKSERIEHNVWIVTCKHAVESHPFVGVRLNTTTGNSLTYITRGASWRRDEEADVAVLRFNGWRNPGVDFAMFEFGQAVEKEAFVNNALYEGTPVALTGYPISMLRTPDRNFPVVQFGYIAQIQGYLAGDQNHPVFLIGGAVFPGNSGGPVLIPGGTPTAVTRYFRRGLLLGMVCAQQTAPTRIQDQWNFAVSQSAYLAQVVPMATVHRAIERSPEWKLQAQ